MSGRRRQTLSPTLFPFLAVLVCTLGTLILLLALVAQNTTEAAEELAESVASQAQADADAVTLTVGDVRNLIEEETFRMEELVSFRDAQTADLETRRDQLAHLEDHERRIREKLRTLSQIVETAMGESPASMVSRQDLEQLAQEVEREKQRIEKLRETAGETAPRVVIVPHQGPNGTDRRPIYLECTADGVTIWPENVSIAKTQLENSSREANPLDSALRAVRYHVMQHYGETTPPYPMLIVRPDGVESYYAARAAMLDWDDQFGYELVPSKVDLAYQDPDPSLRKRIDEAVREAVERQGRYSIVRSLAGRGRRGGAGQGGGTLAAPGPAAVAGGGDPASASAGTRRSPPPISVSQMDRQGRQSGFRDHRAFPRYRYGGASPGGNDPVSTEAARRRLEDRLEDSASELAGRGDDSLLAAPDDDVESLWPENSPRTATGSGLRPGSGQPQSPQSAPPPKSPSPASSPSGLPGPYDNRIATANRTATESLGSARTDDPVDSQSDQRDPAGQASAASSNPSTAPRQPMSGSAAADSISGQATPGGQGSPSRSLVQRGGVDWALPSSVALSQGNDIVRFIRVAIHPDRFVMLPGAGAMSAQTFRINNGDVNTAALELATAARDRITRWGAAIPGGRWAPRLRVNVAPGGQQRFEQFRRLMNGSGLPIEMSASRQATTDPRSQR